MYQFVYPRASHYAVSYRPSPRQMKQKLLILVLQPRAVIPGEYDLFPTLHDNMVKIKQIDIIILAYRNIQIHKLNSFPGFLPAPPLPKRGTQFRHV